MYRLSQFISINFRDELRLKKEIGKHTKIAQRMSWNYYYSYVNMNEAIYKYLNQPVQNQDL